MQETAKQLELIVNEARPLLSSIPEAQASEKPLAEKWSIKEILGHLVDSASNNHQRIVRMQAKTDIGPFTYEQEHWVSSQHYQNESWKNVVDFWYGYNLHLAHVIANVAADSLKNVCDMGYAEPTTLKFVIEDYVRHVHHHLDQIFNGADPGNRTRWEERVPSHVR